MQHLHDDALTLLALGEEPTAEEQAHLDSCPACLADLGSFRRVVTAARMAGAAGNDDGVAPTAASADRGEGLGPNPQAPAPSVWANIHRELNLDPEFRVDPLANPALPGPTDVPASPANSVASLSAARRRRTVAWMAAAAAAAVVAAAGTWGASRTVPGPEVIASGDLSPLAAYTDTGNAVVDRLPDGRRELVVTVSGSAARGYREVWLLAPDAASMVSLGTMDGTVGHFVLSDDLDLNLFPVVDISDEPNDGNPAHSGDSILRGQLNL